ncbi:hypothetical protein TNCV_4883931 [Trichonephila clavipes]|nr:hypothetical protein TNCV_4883931 [Trichonephila clavipes]
MTTNLGNAFLLRLKISNIRPVSATETSRNITARVIERDTRRVIYYFLEDSRGSELANMVSNDTKRIAKVAKLDANLGSKNDANLALPPRFRQVLIKSPL